MILPAPASARNPALWVTVNRCDGRFSDNQMGVRARFPGNGTRQRMYLRFRAQYFNVFSRRWQNVAGAGGRSAWFNLGRANVPARQVGYTFAFNPPPPGGQFVVRGRVDFQYRTVMNRPGGGRSVRVVKRIRADSRSGIRNVPGGDPRGRSNARCLIR